jgi:long-subunit acyl-CoA synthetase (AMP-forming)
VQGSLKDNLLWCRPNHFMAVPRVWEKVCNPEAGVLVRKLSQLTLLS